jgi:WbqC-like protein family
MSSGGVCAIHQPNLFPRWVTVAKLLAADTWVVLDDVQFCRQDYQHRARLGNPDEEARQWLILPVHLPGGRGTTICDVRVADPVVARRRVTNLTRQYYRRAPGWARIAGLVDAVADQLATTDSLADVTETSTAILLRACGCTGEIIRSSVLARQGPISTERSSRLADLTRAVSCGTYLCGRSGRSYLDPGPFDRAGTALRFFEAPVAAHSPLVELTALATLSLRPTVP